MKKGVCAFCCTYNHINYITKALEGFVNQRVDFPYKVIVHDDASTDGTAEIVNDYAKKYSEIIVPILQKENQYSKKKDIFYTFIAPYVDKDYIAICEGDDYWSDNTKLQKQYDYMINNPDVSLCVHNTMRISPLDKELGEFNPTSQDMDYTAEEIIRAGGGGLFHTSSYFMKSEIKTKYPEKLKIQQVGDYPLAIYAALNGRVHYFGKIMSCYRSNVDGSFSMRMAENDASMVEYCNKMIKYLDDLDEYTEEKYQVACESQRLHFEKEKLLRKESLLDLFTDKEARRTCGKISSADRLRIYKRVLGRNVRKIINNGI